MVKHFPKILASDEKPLYFCVHVFSLHCSTLWAIGYTGYKFSVFCFFFFFFFFFLTEAPYCIGILQKNIYSGAPSRCRLFKSGLHNTHTHWRPQLAQHTLGKFWSKLRPCARLFGTVKSPAAHFKNCSRFQSKNVETKTVLGCDEK